MNTAFSSLESSINPFALMMDPATVLDAVQRSDRLNGLASQVFRPLDKPMLPRAGASALSGLEAFDHLIDGIDCCDD